jgi:hypothetical protein
MQQQLLNPSYLSATWLQGRLGGPAILGSEFGAPLPAPLRIGGMFHNGTRAMKEPARSPASPRRRSPAAAARRSLRQGLLQRRAEALGFRAVDALGRALRCLGGMHGSDARWPLDASAEARRGASWRARRPRDSYSEARRGRRGRCARGVIERWSSPSRAV